MPSLNTNILLIERDNVKNIGIIIVTSDKGLCGGLNTNVLRSSISQIKDWEKKVKKFKYVQSVIKL